MSAGLEASTVTPGSTALLASVTTPAIELWAKPGRGANTRNASARSHLRVSAIACCISFFLRLVELEVAGFYREVEVYARRRPLRIAPNQHTSDSHASSFACLDTGATSSCGSSNTRLRITNSR